MKNFRFLFDIAFIFHYKLPDVTKGLLTAALSLLFTFTPIRYLDIAAELKCLNKCLH
jgi:hypothetical protein